MLTVEAPAKINLTLEVLRKRPDGFHEIRSVAQTISLCDTFRFSKSDNIEIRCTLPGWSAQQSLVSKAVDLLINTCGYKGGAIIDVEKHISLMAGLGGDSSDAAAIFRGLNELWRLGLTRTRLLELAPLLGSDVSFFLIGGTALMEGRGDKITSLPLLSHHYVVLVNPSVPHLPGKTAAAYSSLRQSHFTDGQISGKLIDDLRSGKELEPERLYNVFENVFLKRGSELVKYRDHIQKIGAPNVHLAGSGPSLFTLIKDKAIAEDLATRLKDQGMEIYLVETYGEV
jgi:4-diphosphocytidyl-2-C-methyl-D-erythritol kinase